MITGIEGLLGSGKTLLLTYRQLLKRIQKYIIYANYKTLLSDFTIIDVSDILAISKNEKLLLSIDEILSIFDARNSHNQQNIFIAKILLESRKRGFDMDYTQQNNTQADLRLRRITNYWLYPNLFETMLTVHVYNQMQYEYSFTINAEPLFDMYDTNEIIDVNKIKEQRRNDMITAYTNKLEIFLQNHRQLLEKDKKYIKSYLKLHNFDKTDINIVVLDNYGITI